MNPEQLKRELGRRAGQIDEIMRQDLAGITEPRLAAVLEHALFAGGKRVRPLLTLLAAEMTHPPSEGGAAAAGGTETTAGLAISFEYLHAASLLHDDVIDHAKLRRGRETVNSRWDNGTAILAGDFLHARAMLLAGTNGGGECLELIGEATQAMVASEFIQLDAAARREWNDETYFAVLRGKTAALIAAACAAGATRAGGGPQQILALRSYGGKLGIAFQIIDDLLDYLGESNETGKAVGNDLQEGKMTLPLLIAHQRAAPGQKKELEGVVAAEPAHRGAAFERVRAIMEEANAFNACRRRAEELIAEGTAALDIFPDSPSRRVLTALGRYVLTRNK
mgnify:CR=1 FL=1